MENNYLHPDYQPGWRDDDDVRHRQHHRHDEPPPPSRYLDEGLPQSDRERSRSRGRSRHSSGSKGSRSAAAGAAQPTTSRTRSRSRSLSASVSSGEHLSHARTIALKDHHGRSHFRRTDSTYADERRARSAVRWDTSPSLSPSLSPSPRRHGRTGSRGRRRSPSVQRGQDPHRQLQRHRSEDPAGRLRQNKRYEHAVEKAIGAGSAAAFHVRHEKGAWVGVKGLKVVGAASAAALIDYNLVYKVPKQRRVWHVAMGMIQGGVAEAILRGGQAQT